MEEFVVIDKQVSVSPAGGPADDAPPVFVLSFRERDEVAAAAAGAGWKVVSARRSEGLEQRFLASGAQVAVIDARGAMSEALDAAKRIGEAVEAIGAAMLVLVSQSDTVHMREFLNAGATHFLSSPMSSAAIGHAIRFAQRHVERLAGGLSRARGFAEPLGWRYDPQLRTVQLTPALSGLLALPEVPGLRALLASLGRSERRRARAALRRLSAAAPTTAFAHDQARLGRVVQHLQLDPETGQIDALVERLGTTPEPAVAVRDALTGARDAVSARQWIDQRLGEGSVAVLLIGLNRFETINTAYGREAGDGVLRAASRRISEAAREVLPAAAVVARMGGSEFLVACAEPDETTMQEAAQRIEAALARPFVVGDSFVSVGVRSASAVSVAGDTVASLLSRASEALRGEVAQEGPAPLESLAADLRRALEMGEIGVLFQPQVAIATSTIVGVEALARWQHPELGEIGAETLFAAAARVGLEAQLSDQVHRRALSVAARWPAPLARLRLSINVTAGDVARPGFADILLGKVDESGFPRNRLTVEITESGIMADLGEAARLLTELRSAGCRVAIDDFGTGYSSLAYLKALPLDYLKIDRRLSEDITGSARDRIVVRGVIDMARSLGLAVIAEGVETDEQLDLLAKEGCQYFQGFLCAGPLDSDALVRLMTGGA